MAEPTDELTKQQIIEALENCCELFEKLQQKKAVLEAEEIVKEVSNG